MARCGVRVRGVSSSCFCANDCILRASPTAAGPFLVITGVTLGVETCCCRLVVFSLLKCVLARSFLDVNFQVTFLTNNYDFGHGSCHFWYPKSVIWQAWCSTLAPWGTRGRSRGTWEQKKGYLGIQAWIFIDFGWISGPLFESFLGNLDQTECFCNACFQVTFCVDFGV